MDVPWAVIAPAVTAVAGGCGWICKKIWTLIEAHTERRTVAIEAIAPSIAVSIKASFDETQKHVSAHADRHAEAVTKAEANIIATVNTARASIVESIELAKRLERLETASLKAKESEDPNVLERSENRPSRSGVQSIRQSQPAIGAR